MKRAIKRLSALLVAGLMLLSVISTGVMAAEQFSEEIEEPDETPIEAEASFEMESVTAQTVLASETDVVWDGDFLISDGVLEAYKGAGGDVTIPESITSIGGYAFAGCSGLTGVTIPNNVTSIGEGAFEHCDSLTRVTLPASATNIGDGAFSSCGKLTGVTIPNGVTSIGMSAFYACASLTSVTIPASVTSIGDGLFLLCTGLNSVTFLGDAPTIIKIAEDAFTGVFDYDATTTVYYPAGNSTWTSEAIERFGYKPNLTWVAGAGSGDITGDGVVNLKDVTKLFQFVNKQISTLGGNGDITGDGAVNLKDVTKLFQFVNKQIASLE